MTRCAATSYATAACALVAILGCGAQPPDPIPTVRTAKVERRDLRRTVTLRGRLAPTRYIEIRAPAQSVVQDVFVAAGDRVVEGQPVLQTESPPTGSQPSAALPLLERRTSVARQSLEATDLAIQAQRQALERDSTELEAARLDFERLESLYAEGLLARLEFEKAREKLDQLGRGVASRRRELDQLRQDRTAVVDALAAAQRRESVGRKAREQAETSPRLRTLSAPASGYVAMIAARGAVTTDEAAASLALADGLTVRLEEDGPIESGWPATIETPDGPLSGTAVDRREIELEAFPVRWFDGGLQVTIEAPPRLQVTAAPAAALRGGRTVFVVQEGRLRLRTVEPGVAAEGYVEIQSGLELGETVVLSPPPGLADGERVVVHNGRD